MDVRPLLKELTNVLAHARNPRELSVLLEGLLTPQEIREVVFRWRLLNRLLDGATQRQIARELGVSLGKISRGSRLLQFGPSEFREIVERIRRDVPKKDPGRAPAGDESRGFLGEDS